MYNKDKEISRINALNARSASKTLTNSLILEDLEAISVADFLRELSLDDEGRQKREEEEIRKRNADILEAIGKAISATKARAEERRLKEEEEKRRLQKLEEERLMKVIYSLLVYLMCAARIRKAGEGTY